MEPNPVAKGARGLGVKDLLMKNAAMLFKWWWRFSAEDDSLWKRIVGSCNDVKENRPIWSVLIKSRVVVHGIAFAVFGNYMKI